MLRLGLCLILSLTFLTRFGVLTLQGRPDLGLGSMLPVFLKCFTMSKTVVLAYSSLSAIAAFDNSPRWCSVMIFFRISKHFVILKSGIIRELIEVWNWFSADKPIWVSALSCKSKSAEKFKLRPVQQEILRSETYGAPCTCLQITVTHSDNCSVKKKY